jgi:Subtilase family
LGHSFSDAASASALSVAAVDPALGVQISEYSSEGPTNDGRIKPDISAPSCLSSLSCAPTCYDGTSAATPVVSGKLTRALKHREKARARRDRACRPQV